MDKISSSTVGCMATFPRRFNILRAVVESIAPQLDALVIYVNETTSGMPDFAYLGNVHVLDGREYGGDISANGKVYAFHFLHACRIFTLDDDFLYPADYVARNLGILEKFDGRCAVTTHGSIFPPTVDWYYARTLMMVSRWSLASLQLCNLAGSGTFCFDQRRLPLDIDDLLSEVMVDLKLSLAAREAGLPIWVLPRGCDWLSPFTVEGLWQQFSVGQLTGHTYLARQVDWSFKIYADIARHAMKRADVSSYELKLDTELAYCIATGETPSNWRDGVTGVQKRVKYLTLLSDMRNPA